MCGAADRCGGCAFQHLDREHQLAGKSANLAECLSPVEPGSWLPPLAGAAFNYRSKARLGVKFVEKKGRVLVGFREKQKPFIAETTGCPVLVTPVSHLLNPLAALVGSLSVPRSIPQIEVAGGDETTLIFRHLEPLTPGDIGALQAFGASNGLQIHLQPGNPSTVHRIYPDEDDDFLNYSLPEFDLRFAFLPTDFTQVNLEVNRMLVSRAVELLALERRDQVLDAFCGIGNFSLAIARSAGQVTGLELAEQSVERARFNARRNSIGNARFATADLYDQRLEIPEISSINKVLLDPPRSGAEDLVKVLASSNVERVVYVSCNPATLARDVKILVGQGFHLRSAGIIDMFPHTTHIESIALLVRPGQRI